MIYLATMSGEPVRQQIDAGTIGALLTPRSHVPDAARLAAWTWAADNECYTMADAFDLDRYLAWLADLPTRAGCRFATAPDVVGDWTATLDRSEPVLAELRAAGVPAAIVAQDGATPDAVPWHVVDAVFIGGSTGWKVSAAARAVCDEARWRGRWVHMGRVNSLERFALAHAWRCHSVDGTYLAFGPATNLPKLLRWVRTTRNSERQLAMI